MQEIRNIVIFGPAESGKSTLSGYLYFIANKATFDLKRFTHNVERDLHQKYEPSYKFAYVVDRNREERMRLKAKNSGSTKSLHVLKIKLEDLENEVYILDTPAILHKTHTKPREHIKGISFADIGIFVIDIKIIKKLQSNLLQYKNLAHLVETLIPLNIWLKYKDSRNLILVISKMDQAFFSEEEFKNAVKFIESIAEPSFRLAIPISIDVNQEIDYNVLTKSQKFSWYNGPTLFEVLKDINKSINKPQTDNEQIFMSIYKEHELKGIGKLWRGKLLQGTLRNNSEITISPLRYSNSELIDVSTKVIGIYSVDRKLVDSAKPGDIVSVNIKDPIFHGTHIDKNDLFYEKSTCIFDAKLPLKRGDILQFEIRKIPFKEFITEELTIEDLCRSSQLVLIWFGKAVPCKVLHRTIDQNVIITLKVTNRLTVSLPLNEKGDFLFKNFLFEIDRKTYFEGVLNRIGSSSNSLISIEYPDEDCISKLYGNLKEFNVEKEKNELVFKEGNIINLLEGIKSMESVIDLDKIKIKVS